MSKNGKDKGDDSDVERKGQDLSITTDAHEQTIREVRHACAGLRADIAVIQKKITKERGRIKQLGIKMLDFDAIVRVCDLEEADRDQSGRGEGGRPRSG